MVSTDAGGRHLDKNQFPQCLIRQSWDRPRDAGLVADYIRWQAPLLPQLTRLEPEVWTNLEILARQAPEKVAQYH
jgi:hypothetical protein